MIGIAFRRSTSVIKTFGRLSEEENDDGIDSAIKQQINRRRNVGLK
jgi:hypothetical protein